MLGMRNPMTALLLLAAALLLFMMAVLPTAVLAQPRVPCDTLKEPIDPCVCDRYDMLDCSGASDPEDLWNNPGLQNGAEQPLGWKIIKIIANNALEEVPGGAFGRHYAKEYLLDGNTALKWIYNFIDLPAATSEDTYNIDRIAINSVGPDSVLDIAPMAFATMRKINTIRITNGLRTILTDAFHFDGYVDQLEFWLEAGLTTVEENFISGRIPPSIKFLTPTNLGFLEQRVWEKFTLLDYPVLISFPPVDIFTISCENKWLIECKARCQPVIPNLQTIMDGHKSDFWSLDISDFPDCA